VRGRRSVRAATGVAAGVAQGRPFSAKVCLPLMLPAFGGLALSALFALLLSLPFGAIAQTAIADLGLMKKSTDRVLAAAIQPDGKVIIGGNFALANGVPRRSIARLNADGTIDDAWLPPAIGGEVYAIAIAGNTAFLAGSLNYDFSGTQNAGLLAVDLETGAMRPWNLHVFGGPVYALASTGDTVFVGGNFSGVGGQLRYYIAAVNANTGAVADWAPFADGMVRALHVSGNTLYVGGYFLNIGNAPRNRIAALSVETGLATTWNPGANNPVLALALAGNVVYAGGLFTAAGGQPRQGIAALSAATGLATAWNPGQNTGVFALAQSGGTVYAGGSFTLMGGQDRKRIAAVDTATGTATAWYPGDVDNSVSTVVVSGNTVYAGGIFSKIGLRSQLGVARLDMETAGPASGIQAAVGSPAAVFALARQDDGRIVAGGVFDWVGRDGVERKNLLRVAADGTLDPEWKPGANAAVRALAYASGTVYAGGDFTSIGGETRIFVAGLDVVSGGVTAWNPSASSRVSALVASGQTLYAAGDFTSIGGSARNRIAAFDLATGSVNAGWDPNANATVNAMAVSGDLVYVGGAFTSVGGQSRTGLAALDSSSGDASSWDPAPNGVVNTVQVDGDTVYVGGSFTTIAGQTRLRLAAVGASDAAANSWNPGADDEVFALAYSGSAVYVGGRFGSVGGQPRNCLAAVNRTTGAVLAWDHSTSATNFAANALLIAGSRLFVGANASAASSLDTFALAAFVGATAARGDFAGDGRSDLLWRNAATGENYVYPMDGNTILPGEGYVRTVADLNWHVVGTGDLDGDGMHDVLWRNAATGENYVYFMNGRLIAREGYLRTVPDPDWRIAGAADFDGDGRDDILWRNALSGENYVYLMNGLSIAGEGYLRTVADLEWQIVGVGDLDGDGRSDILWRNAGSGHNYVYPMDGTSIKGTEGFLRTVENMAWQVKALGDIDGDGKADIVWRNSTTGENYVYPMDGTAIKPSEGYLRTVSDLAWTIAATGDYDGDGKSDLLWRNTFTGENYLYPLDGKTIKPTEGYIRTVADQNWTIAP